MEAAVNYRILGFFENGFRHLSNRLRPITMPSDLAGMRIRTLNSRIHERTFSLLGATPVRSGLKEAIAAMAANRVDAQENPFANTVTYGPHKFHRFHTMTRHFYISRPIFLNRTAFDGWPKDLQQAMRRAVRDAVPFQRQLAVEEEELSQRAIREHGCEINELSAVGTEAFVAAVKPLYAEARGALGPDASTLLEKMRTPLAA